MTALLSADLVRRQITAILVTWGMSRAHAGETADIMVDADLAGIDSHGVSMLPGYNGLIESGALDASAQAEMITDTGGTAVIDGHHALGHRTTANAMRKATAKALQSGIGAVVVKRSKHFGAAGYYASMAAAEGLIGLVATTTRTRAMVPTHGQRPMLGTNPIAFAAPAADSDAPFVLDMSTTTVAVNKVKVYNYSGEPIPEGWMVDSAGGSITDSHRAYSLLMDEVEGGLTPLGALSGTSSHKGYGLAVMVQILAGALAGISFNRTPEEAAHDGVGHFCLALDPGFFGDNTNFRDHVSEIVDTLRSEVPAESDRPVLVAGDQERATRQRRRIEGIPMSAALLAELKEVCSRSGSEFLLD